MSAVTKLTDEEKFAAIQDFVKRECTVVPETWFNMTPEIQGMYSYRIENVNELQFILFRNSTVNKTDIDSFIESKTRQYKQKRKEMDRFEQGCV